MSSSLAAYASSPNEPPWRLSLEGMAGRVGELVEEDEGRPPRSFPASKVRGLLRESAGIEHAFRWKRTEQIAE